MAAQEKATELLAYLKRKEFMEKEVSFLNKKIYGLTTSLHESMEAENVDAIEIEGIKFTPKEDENFKLSSNATAKTWDDCPEYFAWLHERNVAGIIKTKSSVHWQTREKDIRDYLENGGELPEFIEVSYQSTIKWNKAAVARLVEKEKEQFSAKTN